MAETVEKNFSTTFNICSQLSDIDVNLAYTLKLDPTQKYKMGLVWFSTYNTIFNITSQNNEFRVLKGTDTFPCKIPPGAYEVKDFNDHIATSNKDLPQDLISITDDKVTTKCKMSIKEGYTLQFNPSSFFHTILGFDATKEYKGRPRPYLSDGIIQITDINTINIECSLVNGGYVNTINPNDSQSGGGSNTMKPSNLLYSFPSFTVPLGYKIIQNPTHPTYYPVFQTNINRFNIKITDDKSKLISFNGEKINMCLELKQV